MTDAEEGFERMFDNSEVISEAFTFMSVHNGADLNRVAAIVSKVQPEARFSTRYAIAALVLNEFSRDGVA